ncbi:MAG TPA: TlpA disulfide reductase family protein [Polyangiaceae bacterium]|nr:TlpA disulfide reductase family protein [Polyangiaceae bacterium]
MIRVVFAAFVASACASAPPPAARAPARLPEVSVLSLDRQTASLASFTRGRPALVALWATWCTACSRELAELDRLQTRLGSDALVVGVAVGEPYERVADFLRPRRLAYAQLVDEDFKLSEALGERRVPATLVIDRNGAVRYSGGALDARALDALRSAIAE